MPREDFSSTEAILLRKFPYKEAGAIFTLFTRKYGLVDFIGKGIYSNKNSKMASALEAANLIEIQYYSKPGRSLQIPKRVLLIDDFQAIKEDYDKFFALGDLFKEMRQLMAKEDPHQEIFLEFKSFLKTFSMVNLDQLESSIIKFKMYLLKELGYLPSFEKCSKCNKAYNSLFLSRKWGAVSCPNCKGYESGQIELNDDALFYLRNIREKLHIAENLDTKIIEIFTEIIDYIHKRIK